MPFGYVSPEQSMKDRADYARKGIARGGSVVVMRYADGILLVAENRSPALHKVSEIYDRIAFAAVGKYNEFENLRIAGIRIADLRGYGYDRRDVTARSLANAYAQALGTIFTTEPKPYEVELLVAEVGETGDTDQIYRLTYDGSIGDERGFAVMGGLAELVTQTVAGGYREGLSLGAALRLAISAFAGEGQHAREIGPDQLEVAVLERNRPRARKFSRVRSGRLAALLDEAQPDSDGGSDGGSDKDAPVGPGVDALAPEAPPPGATSYTDIDHDRPGPGDG